MSEKIITKQVMIDNINKFINSDCKDPILTSEETFGKKLSVPKLKEFLTANNLLLLDIRIYSKDLRNITIFDKNIDCILLVFDNKAKIRRIIGINYFCNDVIELDELSTHQIYYIYRIMVLDEPYHFHFDRIKLRITSLKKLIGKYLVYDDGYSVSISKIDYLDLNFEENNVKLSCKTVEIDFGFSLTYRLKGTPKSMSIYDTIQTLNTNVKYHKILNSNEEFFEYKDKIKQRATEVINKN